MERLKARRSARRAQNTRIINDGHRVLQDPSPDIAKVRSIKERFTTNNAELLQIDGELEPLIPIEQLEQECIAIAEYQDDAVMILSELQSKIDSLEPRRLENSVANMAVQQLQDNSASRGPKLPKLELSTFEGELSNWLAFWEQFDGAIHKNLTLTSTDKFHYLCRCLTGDAAAAIAGLPTTETCYAEAITILLQRFGDQRRIERQRLNALRNLPQVASAGDVKGLRNLYDTTQLNIRCLTSLKVPTSSFSAMLCDILVRALPYEITVEYHRQLNNMTFGNSSALDQENGHTASTSSSPTIPSDSVSELNGMLRFLRVEVESRERSGLEYPRIKNETKMKLLPSASALYSTTNVKAGDCYFCHSKKHDTPSCDCDKQLAEKTNLLSLNFRRFRCTLKGHRAKNRQRKLRCAICGGRHVTTMCNPAFVKQKREGSSAGDKTICVSASHAATRSERKNSDGIYLQTFKAWAVTDEGSSYVKGIFDGGIQRSFIKKLAQRLGLRVLRTTRITLNTFASRNTKVIEHNSVVEVKLRSQFNNIEITVEAITIPVICQDVSTPSIDTASVRQLRQGKKNLADDIIFPGIELVPGISLLVGSDHLWKFCTGEVMRCKDVDDLVAINTKLGWTLQGPSTQVGKLLEDSCLMMCVLGAQTTDAKVEETLKAFWELDRMGTAERELGDTNAETISRFEQTIVRKNERYEVALLWKEGATDLLPNNRKIAISRLESLLRRLSTKHGLLQRYDEVIKQYLLNGHAEVVPEKRK
ncbi:uncharacterized protein LOC120848716 [Ixodes scapularis]|uniref:uncharacterized protein LOC120848716 n=1 Tax=Ixodes scapularis TaxID=6945 RepID=UPI001C383DB9|nr:uncharacterized protein LOC120848716 [Ixodes scapularis]